MGIRFRCHHCEHELHVKDFQSGRRSRCPQCNGRFRIPLSDAEHSLDISEKPQAAVELAPSKSTVKSTAKKAAATTTSATAPNPSIAPIVRSASAKSKFAPPVPSVGDRSDTSGTALISEKPGVTKSMQPKKSAASAKPRELAKSAESRGAEAASDRLDQAESRVAKLQSSGRTNSASSAKDANSADGLKANKSRQPSVAQKNPGPWREPVAAPKTLPSAPEGSEGPRSWPTALMAAPDASWFVRPSAGGQYGPASSLAIWHWLQEDRIGQDALVWCEGWPDWLAGGDVFKDYFALLEMGAGQAAPASATPPPEVPAKPLTPAVSTISPIKQASVLDSNGSHGFETLPVERQRLERKRKRRQNRSLMIAVLTVVMIALLGALIFVLLSRR